jgi:hypothetical protein
MRMDVSIYRNRTLTNCSPVVPCCARISQYLRYSVLANPAVFVRCCGYRRALARYTRC